MFTELELTGRARTHVVQSDDLCAAIHRDVVDPFNALQTAAASEGIDLQIASGFRDFDAQLRIWNMKFRGERPVYDKAGKVLDHAHLDAGELIDGILSWSALPGASRHHWGTDIDVIDRAAMAPDYRYSLLPKEYAAGGVFHRLNLWLDDNIAGFGFFRPYADYRGGVYPEPWHLSHAGLSAEALDMLTPELIAAAVRDSDLLGKEQVLAQLTSIHRQYIANICAPSATLRASL